MGCASNTFQSIKKKKKKLAFFFPFLLLQNPVPHLFDMGFGIMIILISSFFFLCCMHASCVMYHVCISLYIYIYIPNTYTPEMKKKWEKK